jgi:uncharacterized pyridoxal phosphate-dependent enzyme
MGLLEGIELAAYKNLGVKKVINAAGTLTALGGSLMEEQTIKAMDEAAKSFVYMDDLAKGAGRVVARITGAEAGLVTSGGAASLAIAAAACMTGTDPDKISQLPDTTGLKSEVIIQKVQRNKYDRCIRISGAKLVDAGDGSGTTPQEFERAISPKTAAIVHFVLDPLEGSLQLEEVIGIARRHGVPVIVDAAAEIPPPENLRKFISMGADLVLVSGGKQLRGPNDSGMLFGRKDLIEAAYLNAFPGSQGIGRAMKISKEQTVGLVVALQRYVAKDHDAEMRGWTKMANRISRKLNAIPHVKAEVTHAMGRVRPLCIPRVEVRLDEGTLGITIPELVNELKKGDPIVEILPMTDRDSLQINPQCLSKGEDDTVVRRMRQVLLRRRPAK